MKKSQQFFSGAASKATLKIFNKNFFEKNPGQNISAKILIPFFARALK